MMRKQSKKTNDSNRNLINARGFCSIKQSSAEGISLNWPGPHPLSKVHPSEYQKVATMLCIQIVSASIGKKGTREKSIESATFYASLIPEDLFNMCNALSKSLIDNAHNKYFASMPQGNSMIVKMLSDKSSLNAFLSMHSDATMSTDQEILEHFIEDIHLYYFDWQ